MSAHLDKLTTVFRQSFNAPDLVIAESTTRKDIAGWDSLKHMKLMVAVEKAFGVRFTAGEVASFVSVGKLLGALDKKLGGKLAS
jgi:acyl carrier protein